MKQRRGERQGAEPPPWNLGMQFKLMRQKVLKATQLEASRVVRLGGRGGGAAELWEGRGFGESQKFHHFVNDGVISEN